MKGRRRVGDQKELGKETRMVGWKKVMEEGIKKDKRKEGRRE